MLPTGITFRKALIWTIRVVVAVVFVLAGVPKILGDQSWTHNFALWGYPTWFRVLVGWGEVLGALALIQHKTVLYAAAGLMMVMVGATVTQVANHGIGAAGLTLLLVILLATVLIDKWPHVMKGEAELDPEFADYVDEENVSVKT
jgi:uncharacterized membrane protein YphA (DoxX/SURF4 family)